jgi:hypothetical protein
MNKRLGTSKILPSVVADDSTVLVNVNGKKSSLKIIRSKVRQKCLAFFLCLKHNDFFGIATTQEPVVYIYSVIAKWMNFLPNSATLPLPKGK